MIDAKELRIGNYISLERRAFTVYIIREQQIDVHSHGRVYNFGPHAYEPIPLTEEWLVKLGFTCYALGDGFIWTKGDMLSGYLDEIIGFSPVDHSLRHTLPVPSVHKLQNLFYALTGEELAINESHG